MSTAIYSPQIRTASTTSGVAPRLRITRRGRAVLTFAVALPLVAGAGLAVLNGGGAIATSSDAGGTFSYVTVEPGQSLWQIAEITAPDADPRDFVADVVDLNQLGSAELQAGDQLAIPAKYAH